MTTGKPRGAIAPAPPEARPLTFRIIYNPRAGGSRAARLGAVLSRLEAAGHRCDLVTMTGAGDAARFARLAAGESADLLVVAGGDGTVNDALQGLGPDSPPLGLIPMGTANVLASEIGMSGDPERIAECLMRRRLRTVRLGLVNERRFMMMASVGLDAQVVADVRRPLKERLGKGAYALQALRALGLRRVPPVQVSTAGMRRRAATVVVSNGKRYGGDFVLAPRADLASPSFQVTLFPAGGALSVMLRSLAIPLGLARRFALVEQLEFEALHIDGPAGAPVQADGDIVAALPARFAFAPDPIRICVPDAAP